MTCFQITSFWEIPTELKSAPTSKIMEWKQNTS